MKKILLTATALVMMNSAQADGFICEGVNEGVKVKLFNKTNPEDGTRNASVLILSDASVGHPNKTIATFTKDSGTLVQQDRNPKGVAYVGVVSSEHRGGEYIMGRRLMSVRRVVFTSNFIYSAPVSAADSVDATLTLELKNGERVYADLSCERYLKSF